MYEAQYNISFLYFLTQNTEMNRLSRRATWFCTTEPSWRRLTTGKFSYEELFQWLCVTMYENITTTKNWQF